MLEVVSVESEPGVVKRLLCGEAVLGVLLEHLLDEVLGLRSEVGPVLRGEGHQALLVLHQDLPVVLAREHELPSQSTNQIHEWVGGSE